MSLFYDLISDDAGRIIRKERKAWGMSQRRLADLVKSDKETIEYIEKGYVCMLDFDLLRRISEVLEVSIYNFFKRKVTDEEFIKMI